MAITDIYNSLTFGGINSLDYGVYISGPAVYNAPTRDVELVSVPGRNGAIEIDKGHWNNIEVTYKAGTFGDDQSDFATKINAFRNAIVSQIGYQRITDTYNPEEYRLGIYLSGLSVNAVNRNEAGEFDLVFNCKPQRYLLEGEDEITVTSGDTITNPTLYDAGPLLMIGGYGQIEFNDYNIDIENGVVGEIDISAGETLSFGFFNTEDSPKTFSKSFSYSNYKDSVNAGDSLILESLRAFSYTRELALEPGTTPSQYPSAPTMSFTSPVGTATTSSTASYGKYEGGPVTLYYGDFSLEFLLEEIELTAFTNESYSAEGTAQLQRSGGSVLFTVQIEIDITNTESGILSISVTYTLSGLYGMLIDDGSIEFGRTYIDSTLSLLGNPLYIDCETGLAYKYEGGNIVNLSDIIQLGSDLPILKTGGNVFTFDNTISYLKVVPRWWEL